MSNNREEVTGIVYRLVVMDETLFLAGIPGGPGPTYENLDVTPRDIQAMMKFVTNIFETHISNVEPVDRELHHHVVRHDKDLLLTCCRLLRAWPNPKHSSQSVMAFINFLDQFEDVLARL